MTLNSNAYTMPYRVFPHGTDWMDDAECRNADRSIFDNALPLAEQICHTCPVQATCLDHLLSWPEQVGYGGGMTEDQRVKEAGAREWAERKRRQEKQELQRARPPRMAETAVG